MLGEFARALTPRGSLALGFFDGPAVAAFDHAVTTVYFWPIDVLAQRVEEASFIVTARHTPRPHGAIIAHRTRPARDSPAPD